LSAARRGSPQIDETFGEIEGGSFFDLHDQAARILGEATVNLLRSLDGRSAEEVKAALKRIKPYRLAAFVEEVQQHRQKRGRRRGRTPEADLDDLNESPGHFLDYLRDLLADLPGVVETTWDFEGGPGGSSLYRTFWVEDAPRVAKTALQQIEQEARSLGELP
jgi:hypothetical protein